MVYLFCLLRRGQCPPSCVSLSSSDSLVSPKLTKPTNNTTILFPLLSALMVWLLNGFIFADVNFSVWGSVVCSFLFCLLKFLEILGLFFIIIKFSLVLTVIAVVLLKFAFVLWIYSNLETFSSSLIDCVCHCTFMLIKRCLLFGYR